MSAYLYAYLQTAGADQRGPKEDNCAIKEIKNIKNMNKTSKKQVLTKMQRLRLNIRTETLQKAASRDYKQQNESLTVDTEKKHPRRRMKSEREQNRKPKTRQRQRDDIMRTRANS